MKRLVAALVIIQIVTLGRAIGIMPGIATAVGVSASAAHDRELESLILREAPGLRAALAAHDNHRAAAAILRWVAPRVAWSLDRPTSTRGESAGDIYFEWFRPARRGVFCAGAADFFQKTLRLFGVPSAKIDFGHAGSNTHVTVLVPRQTTGPRHGYQMFDPTFGAQLEWSVSRRSLPFGMAVELVRDEAADLVRARTVDLAARPLVRANRPAGRCGAKRIPSCGLEYLPPDRRLPEIDGGATTLLALYARGRIFSITPAIPHWFLPGARRMLAGIPTSADA